MKLELKADAAVRLQQIEQLCDDLVVTLESDPDVVSIFLADNTRSIKKASREWAASKERRAKKP